MTKRQRPFLASLGESRATAHTYARALLRAAELTGESGVLMNMALSSNGKSLFRHRPLKCRSLAFQAIISRFPGLNDTAVARALGMATTPVRMRSLRSDHMRLVAEAI